MPTQQPGGGRHLAASEPVVEALDERECLPLIAGGGVGRIGYTSRSVLIQGAAHFVDSDEELVPITELGVQAWPGGSKEQFIRIIPTHITGRRIRRATEPA